jgi:endonuclease YncB( thermonuclease family)
MVGYDSPEMRTKNPLEHEEALEAKQRLIELVMNSQQLVTVEFGPNDKYGRPLAVIYRDGDTESINSKMLKEGYGVPYDGGKKAPFEDKTTRKRKKGTEQEPHSKRVRV